MNLILQQNSTDNNIAEMMYFGILELRNLKYDTSGKAH